MAKTPRYKDVERLVDPKNVKDFDEFISKIGDFEEALEGAARKSKHFRENVSEAATQYKDAIDNLNGMGLKIAKTMNLQADVADDLTNRINGFRDASFDSIQPEVQKDIMRRIELITELQDKIEKVGVASKEGIDFLRDYTGRIGGDIGQWVTASAEFVGKLKKMGMVLAPIALVVGAIVGAFRIVTGIMKRAVERLTEVEDATINIRREFGLSAQAAGEFRTYIDESREDFLALGVSAEQLAGNINEIQGTFGFVRQVTRDELDLINQLNARLGITATASAGVLKIFNLIGDESREVDQNMLLSTIALAEAGKVANAEVFKDIADSSESIFTYFRGTDAELAQAAIRAKQLGLSLSNVTGFAESLLNFEQSISNELEASVLLGRQINLDRARRLAFEGDLVGLQEELLRLTKSVGSFDEMNAFQRKAIADTLGLSVEEMRNMVALETKLSKLTEADRKRFAEMSEEQKAQLSAQKAITSEDIERVKNMGDMQNTMDRIRNTFGALVGNIVQRAQPAIERVLKTVANITKEFNDTFNDGPKRRAMIQAFDRIATAITSVFEKLFKPENLHRIATAVETIIAGATGVANFLAGIFGNNSGGAGVNALMQRATPTGGTAVSLNTGVAGQVNNTAMQAQAKGISDMVMAANRLSDQIDRGIVATTYVDGRNMATALARAT